jgi:hypothetical protein
MTNNHYRAPLALAIVALFGAVTLSPLSGAAPSETLRVFHPGAPGEPLWSVLALEVEGEGHGLDLRVDLSTFRCPFAWGFILLSGSAENATIIGSVTFDFSHGYQGVEAYASGPVTVDESTVDHDEPRRCDSGASLGLTFGNVPAGRLHFLQFKSGTPFAGEAVLTSKSGGITIVAESTGDRTFYLANPDFGSGAGHVAAHSPGFCPNPSVDPDAGFCDPHGWWAGGTMAGADIGLGRSASYAFESQPYYFLGNINSNFDASNATVTDPLGGTTQARATVGAWAGQTSINAGPVHVRTTGHVGRYPSGTYTFSIEKNADVGATLDAAWHAFGADYFFPNEVGEAS